MIYENNKKKSVWRLSTTRLFVFLLIGSFLFGEVSLAAVTGDYNKSVSTNNTLAASEWNNLINDFLSVNGGRVDGPVGIYTAATSTYALDVNGTIHSTTFIGTYTGFVSAANVSNGAFGSNSGGGNYSFPGNVGIGTTTPAKFLDVNGQSIFRDYLTLYYGTSLSGKFGASYNITTPGGANDVSLTSVNNIYFAPGNTITPSMIIQNGGNVGIGTMGPNAKLEVSGDGPELRITRVNSGDSTLNLFYQNNHNSIIRYQPNIATLFIENNYPGNGSLGDISFRTRPSAGALADVMHITSSGNVGIGTTSPLYKLDVNGNGNFNGNIIHGVGTPLSGDDATTKSYVDSIVAPTSSVAVGTQSGFWTAGTSNSIYNANSGNVGIGTTNPIWKLQINDASNAFATMNATGGGSVFAGFRLQLAGIDRYTAALNNTGDQIYSRFNSSGVWQNDVLSLKSTGDVAVNTNQLFVQNSNGNVGIGTTAPQAQLNTTGSIRISSNSAMGYYLYDSVNTNIRAGLQFDPGTAYVDLLGRYNNGAYFLRQDGSNGDISFARNGSEYMRILGASGNVGIGTTNPAYKLDVRGATASYFDQPVFVGTPTANGHAVTKSYVDSAITNNSLWLVNGTNIYNGNSGNVGIGNSGGTVKLKVSGDIESTNTVRGTGGFAGTATGPGAELGVVGGAAYFSGYDRSGSYVPTKLMGSTIDVRHNDAKSDIFVNSSGNVGINTNSPTLANLQIQGSVFATGVDGIFMALDNASTPRLGFTKKFGNNPMLVHSNNMNFAIGMTDNTSVDPAGFSTISQQLVIDTAGLVGIGTASPAYKLDVRATGPSYFDQPVFVGTPTAGGHAVTKSYLDSAITGNTFWAASSNNIYNTNVGNVGVGIANPSARFAVQATSTNDIINLFDNTGAEKMTVLNSGYVGIGTTAPGSKIDVNGGTIGDVVNNTINFEKFNSVNTYGNVDKLEFNQVRVVGGTNWGGNSFQISRSVDSSPMGKLSFYGSGVTVGALNNNSAALNVGGDIAVDPTTRIYSNPHSQSFFGFGYTWGGISAVAGQITIGNQDSDMNFGDWGVNGFRFYNNAGSGAATELMRINGSGNVGIGTASPAYKLDVRASGASYFDQPVFVGTPTATGHAVTKSYVDSAVSTLASSSLWTVNGTDIFNANSGNVGIGTNVPSAKLDVVGSVNIPTGQAYRYNGTVIVSAITAGSNFFFGNAGNLSMSGTNNNAFGPAALGGTTSGSYNVAFGQSALQLNAGGSSNVAIGMQALFNNAGGSSNIAIGKDAGMRNAAGAANSSSSNSLYLGTDTRALASGDSNEIVIGGNAFGIGSNSVVLGNDSISTTALKGNVGIGTTTPTYKLDVRGALASYFDQPVFVGTPTANGHAATKSYVDSLLTGGSGTTVGYWTMNGSNIYNSNGGNVGIGTTTPGAYKLFVNGDTNISGSLNVTGTITGGGALTGTLNAANISAGAFASNTGGGNFSFPGNVGIGTTNPGAKLEVSGSGITAGASTDAIITGTGIYGSGINLNATGAGGRNYAFFSTANSAGAGGGKFALVDMNAMAYRWVVDSTGNVGIGTTGPNTKLEVQGTTRVQTPSAAGYASILSDGNGPIYSGNGDLQFYTNNVVYASRFFSANKAAELLTILNSGNVGIGSTNPTEAKLVINAGAGTALKAYGNGIFTGTLQTQTGSDFAEEFATTRDLEPGTVVVMDDSGYKSVRPCTKSYDKTVVGIVSNNPSIIAGRITSEHKAIIAMMGVVKVKVSDINGGIEKGDLLTTSGIKGYAMKVADSKPGTVIGKALEDLNGATGEINVLVNLQ